VKRLLDIITEPDNTIIDMVHYTNPEKNHPIEWKHFIEHTLHYPGGLYVCPNMDRLRELEARDTAELFQMLIDDTKAQRTPPAHRMTLLDKWRKSAYIRRMITQEQLKALLSYDKDSGDFFWRVNMKGRGGAVKIGKMAGSKDSKGKLQIKIFGRIYFAHRLAFLYMEGKFPENHVDHINRNHTDNRWCNLRHATIEQNMMNRKSKGRELPRGVYRSGSGRLYSAIYINGSLKHLGMFNTAEDAHAAYISELMKKPSFSYYPRD
jgi:hypothetical protein